MLPLQDLAKLSLSNRSLSKSYTWPGSDKINIGQSSNISDQICLFRTPSWDYDYHYFCLIPYIGSCYSRLLNYTKWLIYCSLTACARFAAARFFAKKTSSYRFTDSCTKMSWTTADSLESRIHQTECSACFTLSSIHAVVSCVFLKPVKW